MPYCVNCGVQLKAAAGKCPLCDTPVLLPSSQKLKEEECGVFPEEREAEASEFDHDLWIKLISVITAAPALLNLAIDYVFGNGISWSLYIIVSLGLVWVWCVSPFIFRRNIFPLWLSIDATALITFLLLVEEFSNTGSWALPLAIPLVLFLTVLIFTLVMAFRSKLVRQLQKPALIFLLTALLCLFIETTVDLYTSSVYRPGWSILAAIPCVSFAVILLILQRRQRIVEEIKHWFRI